MARQPRLAIAGELHLVSLRGHNGMAVAVDEVDHEALHAMAARAAVEQGVCVHAYAVAGAEVCWLATPERDESLGRMMQSFGRRYAMAFNRRHGRQGTLWEGRFRSSVLESQSWLLDATVHVETLPVRAGFASQAGEWRWSSAAHHLGRVRDALITEHPLYWSIGNTPFERESAHAHFLDEERRPDRTAALDAAQRGGRAVGSPEFLQKMSERAGRRLEARPRGRPRRT
jgi:putative transposase